MIVTFGNGKGGVGKSTLALNCAVILAARGLDILLVDSDSNKTSTKFAEMRKELELTPTFTCISLGGKTLDSEVQKLATKFDHVLIDVGGKDSIEFRLALIASNQLIMPYTPSQFDCWETQTANDLVAQAKALNPKLVGTAVLNQADTNPRIDLNEEAKEFARDLDNFTLASTTIGFRVSFRRSVGEGKSVAEFDGKSTKAYKEINSLVEEIFGK